MVISMIAAVAENGVIGENNALPWHIPADLSYFHEKVLDKTIVMGRKTFESVGSKPLSNKKNIILSNDPNLKAPKNCIVARSIKEVLNIIKNDDEIMVCGGASVYAQFLPKAQKLYITQIHHSFEGDTYFPEINMDEWEETNRQDFQPDSKNAYPYSFVVFERKNPKDLVWGL